MGPGLGSDPSECPVHTQQTTGLPQAHTSPSRSAECQPESRLDPSSSSLGGFGAPPGLFRGMRAFLAPPALEQQVALDPF